MPSSLITLWRWLLSLTIYAVFIAAGLNYGRVVTRARLAPAGSLLRSPLLVVLALFLLLLAMALVHEAGHLVAGRLAAFRFHLLVVGPLQVWREKGRLRWRLRRRFAPFSGQAASLPIVDHNLSRRLLLFALGGPLATLLLVVVAGAVLLFFPDSFNLFSPWLWVQEIAAFVAAAGTVFFATAMSPRRYSGGLPTDGSRVATLLQGGARTDRWCALVLLESAGVLGRRPRDWDPALIRRATAVPDGRYDDLAARLLAYQHALDAVEITLAGRILHEARSLRIAWHVPLQATLILESAYFRAFHRGDPAEARTWLDQIRRGRNQNVRLNRAVAAVRLAEGDPAGALNAAREGLALLEEEFNRGLAQAEREWLTAIATKAEKQLT